MAASIAKWIADVALGVNVRERTSFYLLYRRHINKEIPDEINRRGFDVFILLRSSYANLKLSSLSSYLTS